MHGPSERKSPGGNRGSDRRWQAGDLDEQYTGRSDLASIPPMIALHVGAAHLAALAAGGVA
jgi:hypothetical protein